MFCYRVVTAENNKMSNTTTTGLHENSGLFSVEFIFLSLSLDICILIDIIIDIF